MEGQTELSQDGMSTSEPAWELKSQPREEAPISDRDGKAYIPSQIEQRIPLKEGVLLQQWRENPQEFKTETLGLKKKKKKKHCFFFLLLIQKTPYRHHLMSSPEVWKQVPHVIIRVKPIFVHGWAPSLHGKGGPCRLGTHGENCRKTFYHPILGVRTII